MDITKLTIIRAVRDMARTDGRLHRHERKILRLIAAAENLTEEERAQLTRATEEVPLDELVAQLDQPGDRLRLFELSVLVAMADGVESADEIERLRRLVEVFHLDDEVVSGAVERARERYFALTRLWEDEDEL